MEQFKNLERAGYGKGRNNKLPTKGNGQQWYFFCQNYLCKRPEEGKKLIPDISIIMKYNKKTGYYEGSSTQGKGKYLVAGITAADLFGNEIFIIIHNANHTDITSLKTQSAKICQT